MWEMPNELFANKSIAVTGAAGNLGSAVIRKLIDASAHLILIDHGKDKLDVLFPELMGSPEHMIFKGIDVTDIDQVNLVFSQAYERFSRLDVLVNTVGGYWGGTPLHETKNESWERMFGLNARPVFTLAQAIVPYMLRSRSGRIINVAARAGLQGGANMAAYSAAKSAVIRLTESLAAELKNEGITANCVLPGTIDTPENRKERPNADFSRWVSPDEIADVILFLASDSAQAITGATIPVYGMS
jgi:NAD(P)-dependent dehydrogenase (short-subunit alcohol dehydrogenase family)